MNASPPCPGGLFILTELFRSWALSLPLPHPSKLSTVKQLWEELRQAEHDHSNTESQATSGSGDQHAPPG